MKTIKSKFRLISLFLGAIILCQSCVAYKPVNSLEKVVLEENKVKIITVKNKTIKFQKIELVDGKYYGVKNVGSEKKMEQIKTEDIKTIKIKDKKTSTELSIIAPIVVLGLILGIRHEVRNNIDIGW